MSDERELSKLLREGQVVVIAGAGVSIGAVGDQLVDGHNVASWQGLLKHGVEHARMDDDRRRIRRDQLEAGDTEELVSVAEFITKAMGGREGGAYSAWLGKTVGALQATRPGVIRALHALGAPIATTNYDNLIEDVTGLDRFTWKDGAQWQLVLRGRRRAVLHLHGHFLVPSSVILGLRSYDDITSDEPAQAMLGALALTTTFLLVGVGEGLDDPNFSALRDWLRRVAPGSNYPHYRLVHQGELEAVQARQDPADRIEPLVYGESHAHLEGWLRRLAPGRPVRGARGRTQRVLELKISRAGVEATTSEGGVTATEKLQLDELRVSMVQLLEAWLRRREDGDSGGATASASELREAQLLGRILYDSVLHGQVKALYDQERAEVQKPDRLALVLKLEREAIPSVDEEAAVTLTALPWELLYGPREGWLARDGRLTLFRALPHPTQGTREFHEPLRILVVRAQPADVLEAARDRWTDEKTLAYDEALRTIMDKLKALEHRHDAVEKVSVLDHPTLQAVSDALLEATPPNIVHYIGYDSFNTARQKRCVALMRPMSEAAEWADSQQFADQFSTVPPKLVFLHLCEGPREGYPESSYDFVRASFTDLARLLLDRGVELVVAMQYPMSPDIGAKFTAQFYESLRAGESVAHAVQAARQQAAMFYRLGAPVLYLHSADESLVAGEEEQPPDARLAGQPVVSKLKEETGNGASSRPSPDRGAARPSGPAIGPASPHATGLAGAARAELSLADFKLQGEVVARAAGHGALSVDTFLEQTEMLWLGLGAGEGGKLGAEALAAETLRHAQESPEGPLARLWVQLSERLAPGSPGRVGY
jgi:hypothetical protein